MPGTGEARIPSPSTGEDPGPWTMRNAENTAAQARTPMGFGASGLPLLL